MFKESEYYDEKFNGLNASEEKFTGIEFNTDKGTSQMINNSDLLFTIMLTKAVVKRQVLTM